MRLRILCDKGWMRSFLAGIAIGTEASTPPTWHSSRSVGRAPYVASLGESDLLNPAVTRWYCAAIRVSKALRLLRSEQSRVHRTAVRPVIDPPLHLAVRRFLHNRRATLPGSNHSACVRIVGQNIKHTRVLRKKKRLDSIRHAYRHLLRDCLRLAGHRTGEHDVY